LVADQASACGAVAMPSAAEVSVAGAGREGQRPATHLEDFCGSPCQRPGCYVQFAASARSPGQRFCCAVCRRALRRVLDRESKWRRRRRRRSRRCQEHGRPPPRGR
jgi:hypothetical protein